MTRSSTKELFTPFKDPEREFCSSRKNFKTLSLDESRSPDFDLFSYQEEYSEEEKVVLFYKGLDVPTRQILDSRGAISSKTIVDAKVAIQENAKYSQKWHNRTSRTRITETSNGLAAIQAQLNNLGKEIKKLNENFYAAQVGCEQCKGGGYRATAPGFYQRNNANHSYQEQRKSMEETLRKFMGESELAFYNSLYARGYQSALILRRPFLSIAHAKIDVFKRKISLKVREEKIIFKSIKPTSSLINRVCMLSLRERMELDLEARLMGETLMLNRSLDPFFGNYIELNDLNVPLELRKDQLDDLMPTIEEGEVVEEFRARNDARMVSKIFGYPSDCNNDKKIRIYCAHNFKFSCMIVLEDMDAYRDEGMGDVIFGKSFLREVGINARLKRNDYHLQWL
nr:hypothetical protein [Tanacetum cinerariifolium]